MNNKIIQLAKEANLDYDVFIPYAWTGEDKDMAKFVELIITNLTKEIEDRCKPIMENSAPNNEYWKGYIAACDDMIINLHNFIEE